VYKLLVMNDYNGLREGLHGGSELVQLNGLVTVSLLHTCAIALLDSAFLLTCCGHSVA